jgi:hypothetical protein
LRNGDSLFSLTSKGNQYRLFVWIVTVGLSRHLNRRRPKATLEAQCRTGCSLVGKGRPAKEGGLGWRRNRFFQTTKTRMNRRITDAKKLTLSAIDYLMAVRTIAAKPLKDTLIRKICKAPQCVKAQTLTEHR